MKNANALATILLALLLLSGCAVVAKPKAGTEGPVQNVVADNAPNVQTPPAAKLDIAYLPVSSSAIATGADYAYPYISSDGSLIAYSKDNSRFFAYDVAGAKETEVPLTYDYDANYKVSGKRAFATPAPSKQILYIATNNKAGQPIGDLFVVGADGSRLMRVKASEALAGPRASYAGAEDMQFNSLAASSTAERQVYLVNVYGKAGALLDAVLVSSDRSTYSLLTKPGQFAAEGEPMMSADGTRIIFKDGASVLYASDFAGTSMAKISSSASAAAVSGDGKTVAFFKDTSDSSGLGGLYFAAADGGSANMLLRSDQLGAITAIALNSDGSEVLFIGWEPSRKGPEIYHYSTSTAVLTRLTDFNGPVLRQLSASADLGKMAFIYMGADGKGAVHYAAR